ncbi:MAG: hypothetical protein JJU36_13500 [Phycisphaeraceae bacterium]|nr:hypothetical protein [Phycisphaeraceae bacterium]
MYRFWILFIAAALGLVAAQPTLATMAGLGETDEFHLVLEDALFIGDEPGGDRDRALLLWLSRSGDDWGRAWGLAGNFNRSHHTGLVTASKAEGDSLSLTVQMNIQGDAWVRGGRAIYEVTLSPAENGGYEGRFESTFRDQPIHGRATGYWLPRQEAGKSVKAGEHPRLLFRKGDLPELRQRMETPLGRAAMERMNTAAGLAMKYQLTGDRDYADQARALTVKHMEDTNSGSKGVRSRVWGWRLEQVALAYDMSYDAWDEDFRKQVEAYILDWGNRLMDNPSFLHGEIQWHMASTYPGTIYYGAAMGALAILGEQGPEPQKPAAPLAMNEEDPNVSPDADYKPGKGVPVLAFDSDEMPREWIFVGGFQPRHTDHLGDLGGVAKARPEVGTMARHEGKTAEFKVMAENHLWKGRHTGGRTKLNITTAINREYHSKSYFFTVIRNDRARWVRLRTDSDAVVYLSGVRLRENDYFRIEPGLYPMMVQVGIGVTNPWGVIAMEPRLAEVSEEEAREGIEAARNRYEEQLTVWQHNHDEWRHSGGADVGFTRLFERTRMLMRLNYQQGIGAGGAQGSSVFPMGHEGPNKYATAYLNVMGRNVSGLNDVTHYLPFKMFSRIYRDDGEDLMQEIVGEPDLYIRNVYHETRDLTGDFFAAMFPIIPEEWQPAALWFWNRHLGVQGPGDAEKLVRSPGRTHGNYGDYDTHPIWVFVNYPMHMTPKHPAKGMPLTWSAPQFGYHGFRNNWDDPNGILVQAWANAYDAGAATRDNAGTFRVTGLGQHWSNPGAFHFGENLVFLPGAEINTGACGKVVYARTEQDGSGVLTIDMSDVYAGSSGNGPLYERYGSVRRPIAFADTGLSGLRSIGVDYSGKSGAPALIVIVDKITGVGKVDGVKNSLWAWQLDSGRRTIGRATDVTDGTRSDGVTWRGEVIEYRPGQVIGSGAQALDRDDCTVDGQRFRITGENGASLQGTFVEPGDVPMRFEERWQEVMRYKRNVSRIHSKSLFAEGEGKYFVVLTITKDGRHPEVTVQGEGLDARVRVGDRTVRFDGTRIVFE